VCETTVSKRLPDAGRALPARTAMRMIRCARRMIETLMACAEGRGWAHGGTLFVGVAFIFGRKKHHRCCYGALSMSNLLKMVAAAALFAGSATLAIAQTSPPDKSKSEAGAPQQGPGQEVPKAGTGTGAGTGGTAMPAPGTPPNPTGITQEKQKSEANDPQQGGKKN
jgi:hypothetical protein